MKKTILFFAGLLLSISLYSQAVLTPFQDWTSTTGSQNFFKKNVTKTDGLGNTFIAGSTLNGSGNYDILVAKYASNGTLQWMKQYDGADHNNDLAADLFVDGSGNVFITGEVVNDTVYGFSDVITIKYNSSGTQQWLKTWDGAANLHDAGASITVDNSGNVYVGGGTFNSSGNTDMLAIKYNSSGTLQWASTFDGASSLFDVAVKIATNATQVQIAGTTQTSTTDYKPELVKYDISTGAFISSTLGSTGSTGQDIVNDVVKDASGNFYIIGGIPVTGQGYNMSVIKLTSGMVISWQVTYNGASNLDDVANSAQVDASGNVYVTGSSTITGQGKNYVTLKYNSSGTLQWTETYNDSLNGDDEPMAMAIDASANIYITGSAETDALNHLNYYTIKYNSSGTKLWSIVTDGSHLDDKATDIAVDTTGLIVVTGQSQLTSSTYQYLTVRYIEKKVVTPTDYNGEKAQNSFLFYKNSGQLVDTANSPVPAIKYYTNGTTPRFYVDANSFSFVFAKIDTIRSTRDTMHRVDVTFKNSNAGAKTYSMEEQPEYLNYFLGQCPNGITEVHGNQRLVTTDIYTKIDLEYSSNVHGAKYYFIVKPGGTPSGIDLLYTGASSVTLNGTTHFLTIATSIGSLIFDRPTVYQLDASNTIVPITAWNADFVSSGTNSYKFNIGTYDSTKALVIEMDLGNAALTSTTPPVWSTFFGDAQPNDIKTDNLGRQYLTGFTSDASFPTTSGLYTSLGMSNATDAFIAKFKNGNNREWVTYYGGSSSNANNRLDIGNAIDIDANHNVYIVGETTSDNLPTFSSSTAGAYYQSVISNPTPGTDNNRDAFFVKLDSTGGVGCHCALWATYFGGVNLEAATDLKLDNAGNILITGAGGTYGQTPSTRNMPTHFLSGAYNNDTVGGSFILKFSTGGVYEWGSFFSADGSTAVNSIDVDAFNAFYITGNTHAAGFPIISPGANSTITGTGTDAFVTKFSTSDTPVWSTFLGGNGNDGGSCIAIIGKYAYVTGQTTSNSSGRFPIKYSAGEYIDSTYAGGFDAFISKFDANSGALAWSTYYGDASAEGGNSICGDNKLNVYTTGYTSSSAFNLPSPNLSGAYAQTYAGSQDGYILALDQNNILRWGTFYGGTSVDDGRAITAYKDSSLYLTGDGQYASATFPTNPGTGTPPPYFSTTGSMYIAKFNLKASTLGISDLTKPTTFDFTVYPNPSTDNLNLLIENDHKEYYIRIYNSIGQEVFLKKSNDQHETVDLNNFDSGIYVVSISMNGDLAAKKIIIQK